MEIQQKENEKLTSFVHHFKIEAKRCDFNNDTSTIHIFIKSLKDTHNITEKDPQTLSEVIKLVEKLSTAQVSVLYYPHSEHDVQ